MNSFENALPGRIGNKVNCWVLLVLLVAWDSSFFKRRWMAEKDTTLHNMCQLSSLAIQCQLSLASLTTMGEVWGSALLSRLLSPISQVTQVTQDNSRWLLRKCEMILEWAGWEDGEWKYESLPVVVFDSFCQGAWRFQEKCRLTEANIQVEVLHVDLRVHVGIVRLPLPQGGEVAHQEVEGVLGLWRDLLDLMLGRFWSQSQGVGRCFPL